jgi:23S rRNA (guanosine2251-2'-O)-methyltransferase
MAKNESIAILYNIRSAENVGAIFRTADAAGITKIYLVGYTPAPVDRFGRERQDIAKSALGAEKTISWESVSDSEVLFSQLKKENFQIIAIEQDKKRANDYKKVPIVGKTAFILGNEVSGLPEEVLSLCDIIAEIPMRGKKESLNVSVAFGIALFRILNI